MEEAHWRKTPTDVEFHQPIYRRERALHVHAGKSADVFVPTTNHIVAVEVNHAHNTVS